MPYTVSAALPEDIPVLSTIQWAALLTNPLIHTLYPQGPTPALIDFTRDSYQKAIQFPSVRLIKAVDNATGEIVAFAKWIVYPEEKNSLDDLEEQREVQASNGGWGGKEKPQNPEGVNEKALRAWNGIITRTRRRLMMQREHICRSETGCSLVCYFGSIAPALWVLDIIHTHPSHQRQGAATSLLRWGTTLAEELRMPCYVECSPAGYPLFYNNDFLDLAEMEINLNKYKDGYGNYRYKHVVMLRMPNVPPTVPPKDFPVQKNTKKKIMIWDENTSASSGRLEKGISGKASLIDIKRSPRPDGSSGSRGSGSLPSLTRRSIEGVPPGVWYRSGASGSPNTFQSSSHSR